MAHAEAPETQLRVRRLEMSQEADNTPTLNLSGALFLSGGLWFKGYAGTYTQLAAA